MWLIWYLPISPIRKNHAMIHNRIYRNQRILYNHILIYLLVTIVYIFFLRIPLSGLTGIISITIDRICIPEPVG